MMRRFRDREYALPSDVHEIEGGEYFKQLQAPIRTIDLDKWGHPSPSYTHRKADDFAHAEVYATLAAIKANLSGVSMFSIDFENHRVINYNSSDFKD